MSVIGSSKEISAPPSLIEQSEEFRKQSTTNFTKIQK